MHAIPLSQRGTVRQTTRVLILRKEGEIIQFLSTAQETKGRSAELIFTLPAGSSAPHAHKHLEQTEIVEVISGRMNIKLNGERSIVDAGATIKIPPGTVHTFGNGNTDQPLVVRVNFEPSGNIEWYFMQMACAAIRNGGRWADVPALEAATIHWTLRKEYRLAWYPSWLQHICFGSLMLMAKLTGAIKNIKPLSLHKAYVR